MEDYTLSFIKQMEHSLRTFIPSFCLAKIDSFFMNENPIMMSHGRQKHQASRTLNTSLRLPANLAEIRQVTTVCILFPGLVPSSYSQCLDSVDDLPFVSDAPSPLQPQDAIRTLQGIVHFIQTLLHHHEGCLTNLNVDSEGTKITVTFGLFPFLHEDDPLRAVLLGLELKALNERSQVGIATARVLSALIGSKQRRAFTVAGGCAKRAAYLMTLSAGLDDAVVCDPETYRISRCLNRCRDENLVFERFHSLVPTPSTLPGHNNLNNLNTEEPDDEFKAYNSDFDGKGEAFIVHIKTPTPTLEEDWEGKLYVNTRPPPFPDLEKEFEVVKEVTVGRSSEKILLQERLDILLEEGEGSLVVIEGEGGIGKTNLIHDFLVKANANSITTLYGAADPLNKSAPYDVWKGIFQAMLEQEDIAADDPIGETESEYDDKGECSEESEWSCRSERSSGMYEYEEECIEPERRISGLKFNFDYASRRMVYDDEQDLLCSLMEAKKKAMQSEDDSSNPPSPHITTTPAPTHNTNNNVLPPQPNLLSPPPIVAHNPHLPPGTKKGDESGEISTRKKQEKKKKTKKQVADYIYSQLELEGNDHLAPFLNDVLDLKFPENEFTLQMPVEARIEKTTNMLAYLLQDPTEAPKIIILENAQNFHPASWSLLHNVAKNLCSVLFIITMRELTFEFQKEEMKKVRRAIGIEPELPNPFAAKHNSMKPVKPLYPYYEINLTPIPMESIVKVVSKQHNLKTLPSHLLAAFGKAEGHPLLALEMAQSLKDVSIRKSGEGLSPLNLQAVDPEKAFNGSAFSSTLQRVIAQRLDLLKPTEQLTLKVASVFGDSFNFADLTVIYPSARSKEHILEDINSLTELKLLKKQPPLPLLESISATSSSNSSGNLYKDKVKESKKRRRRVAITECRCNMTKLVAAGGCSNKQGDDSLNPAAGIPSIVASAGSLGCEGGMGGVGGCLGNLSWDDEDGDDLSSTGTESDDDSKVLYCFTKSVTRETVYNSIIYSQRRGFHRGIVELYESKFAKLGERGLEPFHLLIADHCIKAGNWRKAVDYFEKAGDRALDASSNKEAIAQFLRIKEIVVKSGCSISASPAISASSPGRRGTISTPTTAIPTATSSAGITNLVVFPGRATISSASLREGSPSRVTISKGMMMSMSAPPSTTSTPNNSALSSSDGKSGGKKHKEIRVLRAASWERKLGEAHFAVKELEQAEAYTRNALAMLLGHPEESGVAWMQYQLASEILKQFAKKKLLYSSASKKKWTTPPKDFIELLEVSRCYFLLAQIRYFANDFYVASAFAMKAVKFAELAGVPSKELARGYAAMCYVTSCTSLKSLSKQFSRSSLEVTENSNDAHTVLDVLLMTSHYHFTNAKWKVVEKRLGRALDICFCSCGQTNVARKQNLLTFFAAYWMARGQHSQALSLYDDIARRKPADDSMSPAFSWLGKAIALAYLGQLEEAQEILYHQNKTFFGRQEIIFRQVLCALILLRRRDFISARDTIMSIFEQLKDKTIMAHLTQAFFWCDLEILSFALEVCLLLWEYDLVSPTLPSGHALPLPSEKRSRAATMPEPVNNNHTYNPNNTKSGSAMISERSSPTPTITTTTTTTPMPTLSLQDRLVQWQDTCNKLNKMIGKYTKVFVAAKPRSMRYTSAMKHLMGHPKTAQRGWQKALDSADKLGMAYECGVVHLWMGRALHEPEKKKKHFDLAMQVFARDEKGYYLSWCRDELEALMGGGPIDLHSSSSLNQGGEGKELRDGDVK